MLLLKAAFAVGLVTVARAEGHFESFEEYQLFVKTRDNEEDCEAALGQWVVKEGVPIVQRPARCKAKKSADKVKCNRTNDAFFCEQIGCDWKTRHEKCQGGHAEFPGDAPSKKRERGAEPELRVLRGLYMSRNLRILQTKTEYLRVIQESYISVSEDSGGRFVGQLCGTMRMNDEIVDNDGENADFDILAVCEDDPCTAGRGVGNHHGWFFDSDGILDMQFDGTTEKMKFQINNRVGFLTTMGDFEKIDDVFGCPTPEWFDEEGSPPVLPEPSKLVGTWQAKELTLLGKEPVFGYIERKFKDVSIAVEEASPGILKGRLCGNMHDDYADEDIESADRLFEVATFMDGTAVGVSRGFFFHAPSMIELRFEEEFQGGHQKDFYYIRTSDMSNESEDKCDLNPFTVSVTKFKKKSPVAACPEAKSESEELDDEMDTRKAGGLKGTYKGTFTLRIVRESGLAYTTYTEAVIIVDESHHGSLSGALCGKFARNGVYQTFPDYKFSLLGYSLGGNTFRGAAPHQGWLSETSGLMELNIEKDTMEFVHTSYFHEATHAGMFEKTSDKPKCPE